MPLVLSEDWPEIQTPHEETEADPALVGQVEWCHLIPILHRGMAAEVERVPFPRLPEKPRLDQACAFWETALYFCRYVLGWVDIGAGLKWWIGQGRPTNSEELEVLGEIFGGHPQFNLFALWAWHRTIPESEAMAELSRGGRSEPKAPEERLPEDFQGPRFVSEARTRLKATEKEGEYIPNPYFGGTSPLHLSHSWNVHFFGGGPPDQDGVEGNLYHTDFKERSGVLILDRAQGWYRNLSLKTHRLQQDGWRSYHIDVIVKPIGWLGTYRRSGDSGLWFLGKHSVHMKGAGI